jgi:hypothetical protein
MPQSLQKSLALARNAETKAEASHPSNKSADQRVKEQMQRLKSGTPQAKALKAARSQKKEAMKRQEAYESFFDASLFFEPAKWVAACRPSMPPKRVQVLILFAI